MGLGRRNFTAPCSCRIWGRPERNIATSRGATAIQLNQYKFGSGKITTCRMADRIASSHALLSIRSIEEKGYQEKGSQNAGTAALGCSSSGARPAFDPNLGKPTGPAAQGQPRVA